MMQYTIEDMREMAHNAKWAGPLEEYIQETDLLDERKRKQLLQKLARERWDDLMDTHRRGFDRLRNFFAAECNAAELNDWNTVVQGCDACWHLENSLVQVCKEVERERIFFHKYLDELLQAQANWLCSIEARHRELYYNVQHPATEELRSLLKGTEFEF